MFDDDKDVKEKRHLRLAVRVDSGSELDELIRDWASNQSDVSFAVKLILKGYIEKHGNKDVKRDYDEYLNRRNVDFLSEYINGL